VRLMTMEKFWSRAARWTTEENPQVSNTARPED
jgi:hypothetical protein